MLNFQWSVGFLGDFFLVWSFLFFVLRVRAWFVAGGLVDQMTSSPTAGLSMKPKRWMSNQIMPENSASRIKTPSLQTSISWWWPYIEVVFYETKCTSEHRHGQLYSRNGSGDHVFCWTGKIERSCIKCSSKYNHNRESTILGWIVSIFNQLYVAFSSLFQVVYAACSWIFSINHVFGSFSS